MKGLKDKILSLFQRFKIRTRITLFLIVFTVIPSIIIFGVACAGLNQININYIKKYINVTQQMTEASLKAYIDRINSSYLGILGNDDFFILLQKMYNGLAPESEMERILDTLVTEYVEDIDIIDDKGRIYNCRYRNHINKDTVQSFSEESNWSVRVSDDAGNYYYVLCKNLINIHSQKNMGKIIFYIPESGICDTFNSAGSDDIYLSNSKDEIVSGRDKRRIGNISIYNKDLPFYPISIDEDRYFVSRYTMENSEYDFPYKWTLTTIISRKPADDLLKTLLFFLVLLIGIVIVTAPVLSIWLSSRAIHSITLLQKDMNNFTSGKELVKNKKHGKEDEIAVLENNFDEMVDKIRELMEKNNIEKEKQRVAELNALQAQINPHFVYNTLDSISWLAKKENKKEIVDMVFALSNFFRISLHNGDKYITLGKEIEHVKSYLTVEQFRFPDKFSVSFDIDGRLENEMMLKIILQPLVENAIKHGVRPKKEKCNILIKVWSEEDYIYLEVKDDGVGFDTKNPPKRIGGGYGLKNIRMRIEMEYGKECGLFISSKPGLGTSALIKIKKKIKL